MKKAIVVSFLGLLSFVASAQQQKPVQSIRLAVEINHVGSVLSNNRPAINYSLIRSQQIKLSRWDYEVSVGYINYYIKERFLSQYDAYHKSYHSQRFAGNLNFLYNPIRTSKHALRIGAGPAIWYQRNGRATDVTGVLIGQPIENITFTWVHTNEFNMGINLKADYEYAITPALIAGIRTGVTGKLLSSRTFSALSGNLFGVGLSVGYRF